MNAAVYRASRKLAAVTLRLFPTCDLQLALERRLGVDAMMLGPFDEATLQIGNRPARRLCGPCTVTVNRD